MADIATIDNAQWPLNSILVAQEYRVLYTPIAKNANTTLKRLFVRLSGDPRRKTILRDVHNYLVSHPTGLSLCDYSPEEAAGIMADNRYFRYVMLRDPLARTISGYLEKFVVNPLPVGENGKAPYIIGSAIDWVYEQRDEKADYERSVTFEEFVDYLYQNDDRNLDTHFKSQQSFLVHQRFDYMGALEKMDQLSTVLEQRFRQKIDLEHHNPTRRRKPLLRRRGQEKLLPAQLRAQRALPHASELLIKPVKEQLNHRYAGDMKLWQQSLT